MDERGVFPQSAHHSPSVRKHGGSVLSSISLLLLFYLLPTFPSIIPHLTPQCFPLSWPNYFPLHSAPPALWLFLFLYIVQYNFPFSFHIISRISLLLLSSLLCTYPLLSLSLNCSCSAPSPSLCTISAYDCPGVELFVRNLSLSQQINYSYS